MDRSITSVAGVPDMHLLILTGGGDPGAIGRPEDIANPTTMATILAELMPLIQWLPDLDRVIFSS